MRRRFICASTLLLLAFISAASALDYQIQANIRYDHYPETVLDILQPSAPSLADRPGVIVIHGGGWVEGNKERVLEEYCLPFVRRGMVVANIEYRLANSAPAPAAVNDVLKAAQWFQEHAARYKVDRKRILVAGDSAGGHLALMTAMTPASADLGPSIKIAAVIDFFGIADVADQTRRPPSATLRDGLDSGAARSHGAGPAPFAHHLCAQRIAAHSRVAWRRRHRPCLTNKA